jgi:fermentation-respiration switch protein FrsA (DUF1100 family)
MRHVRAVACHALILVGAYAVNDSPSGFLVTGVGLALVLDRLVFHQLPGPPAPVLPTLGRLAAYFSCGAAVSFGARLGIVPWGEAAYRGGQVMLFLYLAEQAGRSVPRHRLGMVGKGVAAAVALSLLPGFFALHPLRTVPKRTPAAQGLAFEDVRFVTADGVTLAGWLVPHPQARGNVIFCHGHGRNRGHAGALVPTFHELGLTVLAFDFRGHGDSGGQTSTFGHREVGDLTAAVAYLRGRNPGRPVLVVGVSLGAAVALQALPDLPEVAGVWSEGAFARFDRVIDHYFQPLPVGARWWQARCCALLGRLDGGFRPAAINPIAALERARVPICFCHGLNDDLIPPAEGQALYDAYAGPKACWWVAGATHYDVRQRHPEEYRRRLGRFVERCLADGAIAVR